MKIIFNLLISVFVLALPGSIIVSLITGNLIYMYAWYLAFVIGGLSILAIFAVVSVWKGEGLESCTSPKE